MALELPLAQWRAFERFGPVTVSKPERQRLKQLEPVVRVGWLGLCILRVLLIRVLSQPSSPVFAK